MLVITIEGLFAELEKKCKLFHQKLRSLNDYTVTGLDFSPVKHVRLAHDNTLEKLERIVDYVSSLFLSRSNAPSYAFKKFPRRNPRPLLSRWLAI